MQRQPFQNLPKLTDQKPLPPQGALTQNTMPRPTTGLTGAPNTPYAPMQPFSTGVTGQGGLTDIVKPVSPYNAPDEWYKQEWMKFSIPEQRAMTSWLPHFRTLFFAARMYGDQKVKVRDETTGVETEMTGWEAATKIGQEADKANHQQYLDWRSERRTGLANQQQQEIPFRVTAA